MPSYRFKIRDRAETIEASAPSLKALAKKFGVQPSEIKLVKGQGIHNPVVPDGFPGRPQEH